MKKTCLSNPDLQVDLSEPPPPYPQPRNGGGEVEGKGVTQIFAAPKGGEGGPRNHGKKGGLHW